MCMCVCVLSTFVVQNNLQKIQRARAEAGFFESDFIIVLFLPATVFYSKFFRSFLKFIDKSSIEKHFNNQF